MTFGEKITATDPGTLLTVIGMPGSGKSTYIKVLHEQDPSISIYDDYQGDAFNDDPDPRLSKHFGPLVRDLKLGRTALVSDVRYCIPAELNIFLGAVLSVEPNVLLRFKYFENNPDLCKQNVLARNREGRVDQELELIENLSANYIVPSVDVMPVYNPNLR